MSKNLLRKKVQHEAYHLVIWQAACALILAFLALIVSGTIAGLSVLLGGLAYCLPNLIFVWRVFRYAGAQQMVAFMAAFFIGEMLKLILSGFLFLLIVKYLPHSLLSVLIGYIGAIVSFWIVCMWHVASQAKAKQQVLW